MRDCVAANISIHRPPRPLIAIKMINSLYLSIVMPAYAGTQYSACQRMVRRPCILHKSVVTGSPACAGDDNDRCSEWSHYSADGSRTGSFVPTEHDPLGGRENHDVGM